MAARDNSIDTASLHLGALALNPVLRHRNGVGFLTLRSWRADARADDIRAFKAEKLAKTPAVIEGAAVEIAGAITGLVGSVSGWCVTCVPCGHSRDPDCWGKTLARRVAHTVGAPFIQLFADRFVSGVSHPKEFRKLPPLQWAQSPTVPVLLVDDLATSGWHLEEATRALRAITSSFAVAWIGGTSNQSRKIREVDESENPFAPLNFDIQPMCFDSKQGG